MNLGEANWKPQAERARAKARKPAGEQAQAKPAIFVRMEDEREREMVKDQAWQRKMSLNAFCRKAILYAIDNDLFRDITL